MVYVTVSVKINIEGLLRIPKNHSKIGMAIKVAVTYPKISSKPTYPDIIKMDPDPTHVDV